MLERYLVDQAAVPHCVHPSSAARARALTCDERMRLFLAACGCTSHARRCPGRPSAICPICLPMWGRCAGYVTLCRGPSVATNDTCFCCWQSLPSPCILFSCIALFAQICLPTRTPLASTPPPKHHSQLALVYRGTAEIWTGCMPSRSVKYCTA